MHPAPVLGVTLRVLPLWLAWLAVVVLGRLVCHVAQRLPPVVRLVRLVRRRQSTTAPVRFAARGSTGASTGSRSR